MPKSFHTLDPAPVVTPLTRVKKVTRTSGNIVINNTAWTALDTGMDLFVAAVVGDTIEMTVNFATGPEGVSAFFDVGTIVSAAVVNRVSGTGAAEYGIQGWTAPLNLSMYESGSYFYTVLAGDLSGGTVTMRLLFRTQNAVNKTVYANTGNPCQFAISNRGPAL
jgi:hypothetical protein